MAADLHLVLNNRNNYNLVYEGRVHLLRQTVGLPTVSILISHAVYTNLEVNTVLRSTPHSETCTADES
ncbi:hypothetical protein T03_4652, partial [Trichinella britovi]